MNNFHERRVIIESDGGFEEAQLIAIKEPTELSPEWTAVIIRLENKYLKGRYDTIRLFDVYDYEIGKKLKEEDELLEELESNTVVEDEVEEYYDSDRNVGQDYMDSLDSKDYKTGKLTEL